MIRLVLTVCIVLSIGLMASFQSVKPTLTAEDILRTRCEPSAFFPTQAVVQRVADPDDLTTVITPTPTPNPAVIVDPNAPLPTATMPMPMP